MKILTSMIVGGALMLGTVMAQSTPKPAAAATPAAKSSVSGTEQTKVKKHRKHNKTAKPAAAVHTPAAPTK